MIFRSFLSKLFKVFNSVIASRICSSVDDGWAFGLAVGLVAGCTSEMSKSVGSEWVVKVGKGASSCGISIDGVLLSERGSSMSPSPNNSQLILTEGYA